MIFLLKNLYKKYSLSIIRKFFKDSIIYGLAAVLPRVINFLLVRLHTDALPANAYAENTDFYIWAALMNVVLSLGFETTFFRFFKDERYKKSLISTSMIGIGGMIVLFIISTILFFDSIQATFGFGEHSLRLKMFIAIMVLDAIAIIPFAYLRATNRPIRYTAIKLINVGIIVVIQLITLRWIPNGVRVTPDFFDFYQTIPKVDYIFLSNVVGSLVSLILVIPYIRKTEWLFDKELLLKMLTYSYPIVIAGLAYAINENLDKWLIGSMIDKQTEGLYSAAYKIAVFMNLFIMAFRLGAEPLFFNISKNDNATQTYAVIMKYFVIAGSTVLVAIIMLLDVFKHLINPSYWSALDIIPVVLLANLFLGIYHNLSIWYKLIDKTIYGMWFSIVGAVLTIVLNVLLLKNFGYMVAAWATLVAYGVMMLLSYFYGSRKFPVAYPIKSILIYILASVVISFAVYYYIKPPFYIQLIVLIVWHIVIYVVAAPRQNQTATNEPTRKNRNF